MKYTLNSESSDHEPTTGVMVSVIGGELEVRTVEGHLLLRLTRRGTIKRAIGIVYTYGFSLDREGRIKLDDNDPEDLVGELSNAKEDGE